MLEPMKPNLTEAGRESLPAHVFNHSSLGILLAHLDGLILHANDAFLFLVDRDRDEVVGHTIGPSWSRSQPSPTPRSRTRPVPSGIGTCTSAPRPSPCWAIRPSNGRPTPSCGSGPCTRMTAIGSSRTIGHRSRPARSPLSTA